MDTRVPPVGKLVIWLMGPSPVLFDKVSGYGMHAIQVHYARGWFGDRFFEVYLRFKRAEMHVLDGLAASQVCARYAAVY